MLRSHGFRVPFASQVIRDLGFTIAQKTVDELVYQAQVRGDIVHTGAVGLDYDSFIHFMQILNDAWLCRE